MTTTALPAPTAIIPGYIAGHWAIDPIHSDISFTVRHMMVSKVRGQLGSLSGEIVTAPDPLKSSATLFVDVASVATRNDDRDQHVRSADFFDVATHPTASFRSTGIEDHDGDWVVVGDLTIKGVTRPVEVAVEIGGIGPDAYGGTRLGLSGTTSIARSDFGIGQSFVANNVVVVSDRVDLNFEIEAVLQAEQPSS